MAQSLKRFSLSGPKRPVSVCSLPNEHDFDDVISIHTHFDVTIDLVTGKTCKQFILTLKQVVKQIGLIYILKTRPNDGHGMPGMGQRKSREVRNVRLFD